MFEVNLKKNKKYKICTCGISKKLPLCDNEHRKLKSEKGTVFNSIKIIPSKDLILKIESKKWLIDEK